MSPRPPAPPFPADRARDLAAALARRIEGEVRFDEDSRGLYSTDASNYRQIPIGVVIPRDLDDIVATVALCREYDAPVLARGGGTSLAGQCCNVAVVIDTSKYLGAVTALDPMRRRARVQPGCVLDDLRAAAERHHLTFGPDPATHTHNTLGGMIGNNSCGIHSVMAGRTGDNVESLEVLTYDGSRLTVGHTSEDALERIIANGGRRGEIYAGLRRIRDRYADSIRRRFPRIPRRVSGFALDQLLPENGFHVARALVGSEGTCALILGAELRLVPSPPARVLAVLGYPDIFEAADYVSEVRATGPIGLEGIDERLLQNLMRKHMSRRNIELLPEGQGWLLAEFGGGTAQEAAAKAEQLAGALNRRIGSPRVKVLRDPDAQEALWEVRESGLGVTAFVPGQADAWPGWEDSAVAPERLGGYLRDLRKLLNKYDYEGAFYGHFGDGCLHTRINFTLETSEGARKYRIFIEEAADLVVRHGGSLSGEHGDGQARAELLPKMYGDELVQAFREFKGVWDPEGRLNPGKVVDAYPVTSSLRLQAPDRAMPLHTHFAYPEDHGSFAHAATRCVGVGKCRRQSGGVMCPSFMATREEKHTTRGRARLLYEMLHEGALTEGWKSEAVRDALDLCLACKGCKSDCPVNVDMATYKAEFHARYYAGRLRPRSAYAFGLIHRWARLASRFPRLANGIAQSSWGAPILKRAADIAPPRQLPRFAGRPFTADYGRRAAPSGARPVLLWPDTFNNYFTPAPLHAAVDVLTAAGYTPIVPGRPLCCGRPLYAWGWLDRAKKLLIEILDTLEPQIRAGVPVVGLEPACMGTFRDELTNLLPHDQRAQQLQRQAYLFSDFLERQEYRPPQLALKAIVHAHCHQHAVFGMDAERAVLARLGLDFHVLDSGCCGMAGDFGFESSHYEVSMKAGERVLLPAVRQAAGDTLIVTDGYSCREQIAQATGRRALHVAEVLRQAVAGQRRETMRGITL